MSQKEKTVDEIYKIVHNQITELGKLEGLSELEAREKFTIEMTVNKNILFFLVKLDNRPRCLMECLLNPKTRMFEMKIKRI